MCVKKLEDSIANLIANSTDMIEGLGLRIFKRPIVALKPRNVRTLIPTPHRDQERGVSRKLIGLSDDAMSAQIDGRIMSALVRAQKPATVAKACCGPTCCA